MEGWVQMIGGAHGPGGFGNLVDDGSAKVCGKGRDGDVFFK